MRNTILLTLLLVATNLLATEKQIKVTVDGMICDLCSKGINERLKRDKAVKDVNVNFDDKTVQITLYDGKEISDDKIRESISDAGFETRTIKR